MIKVGIISYGYSAITFHIPLVEFCDELELLAISTSQAVKVKEKYPSLVVFDKNEDLIASSNIDLIIITSPNTVHYELAKLCLLNNKHVVIEKPMTTTAEEAQELINLAKTNSLMLSVFHNRRWDCDFLSIKKVIDKKLLGSIRLFESHFDRFRPIVKKKWKNEQIKGNCLLYDLGSHLIDQAICLFGLPKAITAVCLIQNEHSNNIDYFHLLLHYDNLEVILHSSTLCLSENIRFSIQGTKGSLVKKGLDIQEEQLKQEMSISDAKFGIEDEKYSSRIYAQDKSYIIPSEIGAYTQYYKAIVNVINNNGISPVDANDALNVIKVIELALESNLKGMTIKF